MVIKETLKFEQDLYNLINTCGLPVDTAFYVLKSVYLDFQQTLYKCVKSEGPAYSEEKVNWNIDDEKKENEDE